MVIISNKSNLLKTNRQCKLGFCTGTSRDLKIYRDHNLSDAPKKHGAIGRATIIVRLWSSKMNP